MHVALESFGLRKVDGKKIAILGDMRELGPTAPALHAELADDVKNAGVSVLLTYGENMQHLHDALKKKLDAHHFKTMDALLEKLFDILQPHDAMIVKSSLGVGFIHIINALKQKLLRLRKIKYT
jgi:UDP-N-acetylmuramoyl-tripeptide--D-alanyl-D-alanine ligase